MDELKKIKSLYDFTGSKIADIIGNWIKRKRPGNFGPILNLVDVINDNNIEENIIWHYTKLDVLEKMLLPDKVSIRLTNIKHLNDVSEGFVVKPFLMNNSKNILHNLKNGNELGLLDTSNEKLLHLLKISEEDFNELANCVIETKSSGSSPPQPLASKKSFSDENQTGLFPFLYLYLSDCCI